MAAQESNGSCSALTPAAAYLRRSSSKQETSITDQRKHVKAYAKERGYEIERGWRLVTGGIGYFVFVLTVLERVGCFRFFASRSR